MKKRFIEQDPASKETVDMDSLINRYPRKVTVLAFVVPAPEDNDGGRFGKIR